MDRHRTAFELDKEKARELRILAEDNGTNVSLIVRTMIFHFLNLPDGTIRERLENMLSNAAATESARRGAVAVEALYGRSIREKTQSHTDRRQRISLVLEKGQTDAIKNLSRTSAAVSIRTLVTHYMDVINGTETVERESLLDALEKAASAETQRRADVGRKVMTERHAASRAPRKP